MHYVLLPEFEPELPEFGRELPEFELGSLESGKQDTQNGLRQKIDRVHQLGWKPPGPRPQHLLCSGAIPARRFLCLISWTK